MVKILISASEREKQITIASTSAEQRLPIETYVQVYPRVSTPEQMKNVSAEMQQDRRFALSDDDNICRQRSLPPSDRIIVVSGSCSLPTGWRAPACRERAAARA